jgi:hypothetical protein
VWPKKFLLSAPFKPIEGFGLHFSSLRRRRLKYAAKDKVGQLSKVPNWDFLENWEVESG